MFCNSKVIDFKQFNNFFSYKFDPISLRSETQMPSATRITESVAKWKRCQNFWCFRVDIDTLFKIKVLKVLLGVERKHVWYRKGRFFNLHGKKIKWTELQFVIFQSSTSRRCLFYILLLTYNNPLNMKI